MDDSAKNKWNNIYAEAEIGGCAVSKVIEENNHLLPLHGRALDLACGTAGDAVYLAKRGLQVDAWDISDHVIAKIATYANIHGLSINAEARDINIYPPAHHTYDVISVVHFLERDLIPVLVQALKPGGLIFYQTFSKTVTATYSGPKNSAFRLDENELLKLFADLQLIVYREEGLIGDVQRGFRNEAMLIGQKK